MTSPSLLILGADAVLAAAPATPVQLAHACAVAGYDAVVPVSWGEEIIARRAITALEKAKRPLLFCVCPLARQRFGGDASIAPMTFACNAPPLVTAAYLRALSAPSQVHVTYVGRCSGANHPLIDVRLSPEELHASLLHRGISVTAQPTDFDAVLPPDRRRHFSDAGGLPAASALERLVPRASVVQLQGSDVVIELAQQLLGHAPSLIDVGAALGCSCSIPEGRARLHEIEPPRSPSPVVDHDLPLILDRSHDLADVVTPGSDVGTPGSDVGADAADPPASPSLPVTPLVARRDESPTPRRLSPAVPVAVAEPPVEVRRRQSSPSTRVVVSAAPPARASGRQLPRAYVARRRSSPVGLRRSGIVPEVPADERHIVPHRFLLPTVVVLLVAVAFLLLLQLFGR